MSNCATYRVEVDGCIDGIKTVAVELYAGLPGATGPSGIPSSIPGATGSTGPSGLQGIQGPQGESIIGATGPRGLQGERGEQGATGISGERGERGSTGPSGPRGEEGATGEQGVSGQTGAVGATGSTGPVSTIPGATGATGPIPTTAVVSTQVSRFTGDGLTSVFFPLSGFQSGDTGARYLVQLDGIEQDPDPTNGAFVIASNQISFASAIPSGTQIVVRRLTVSLS